MTFPQTAAGGPCGARIRELRGECERQRSALLNCLRASTRQRGEPTAASYPGAPQPGPPIALTIILATIAGALLANPRTRRRIRSGLGLLLAGWRVWRLLKRMMRP